MEPTLHKNATKHLRATEVLAAWGSVTRSVRREAPGDPPRWLMVGWLPSGVSVELVAVETTTGWLVIHAMAPAQKKFLAEIARAERRAR